MAASTLGLPALVSVGFALELFASPCAASDAAAERGRDLAEQHGCPVCHRMPGTNGAGSAELGPPLAGFGGRSYIAGHLPNQPPLLAQWLFDPPALVPGTLMPRTGLSQAEARDVAAWLGSLHP
jgi:cytochrome c2